MYLSEENRRGQGSDAKDQKRTGSMEVFSVDQPG